MADEETKQNEEVKEEVKEEQTKAEAKTDSGKKLLLPWIIMAVFVVVLALAGFFLGSNLGSLSVPVQAKTDISPETDAQTKPDLMTDNPAAAGTKGWYYDLEPVATNLSDPGSTRYVRAVLTLEMSPEADQAKGVAFLDEKKPVIANILNIYFAGLTIENINSDKDMRRIQYELLEIFNDTLYKDSKPLVREVLFREFGLQ